jgi:hypothetical protein
MGIEPSGDSDATAILPCGCVVCRECRAARALQNGRSGCLDLSTIDAELQAVIAAWDGLPAAIKKAVAALIGS